MKKLKYKLIHFFDKIGLRRKRDELDFLFIVSISDDKKINKKISWLTDDELKKFKEFELKRIKNSFAYRIATTISNALLDALEKDAVEKENYERAAKIRDLKNKPLL